MVHTLQALRGMALVAEQRSSPVPTECSPTLFEFAPVEGRQVVAAFDGGATTSDAGALLLGETDRAIGLTKRFASCFADARMPELIEHAVGTMVLQRVVGIALGYEDLNDHDALRHDRCWRSLPASLQRGGRIVRRWRASRR